MLARLKPAFRGGEIAGGETVTGVFGMERDVGAAGAQMRGKAVRVIARDNWIAVAAGDEYALPIKRAGRRR